MFSWYQKPINSFRVIEWYSNMLTQPSIRFYICNFIRVLYLDESMIIRKLLIFNSEDLRSFTEYLHFLELESARTLSDVSSSASFTHKADDKRSHFVNRAFRAVTVYTGVVAQCNDPFMRDRITCRSVTRRRKHAAELEF